MSEWKEKSRTKIFYGVKSEHYKAFLDNFCKSAQLDKKLRKDFEQLQDTLEKIGENKKTFSLKNTATTGTYGMYVAVKDPATVAPHHKSSIQLTHIFKGKIDVAYAMYDYKAKFKGEGLKKGDVDVLSENYIVTKALLAFAHNGTIPKVLYFWWLASLLKSQNIVCRHWQKD